MRRFQLVLRLRWSGQAMPCCSQPWHGDPEFQGGTLWLQFVFSVENRSRAHSGVSNDRFSRKASSRKRRNIPSFLKPGERKRIKSQLAQRAKRKKVSRKLDIDPKALPRTGVDHKLL